MSFSHLIVSSPGPDSTNQQPNQILELFLPKEVAALLLSSSKTKHQHRSFILNFTCGALIRGDERDKLITG